MTEMQKAPLEQGLEKLRITIETEDIFVALFSALVGADLTEHGHQQVKERVIKPTLELISQIRTQQAHFAAGFPVPVGLMPLVRLHEQPPAPMPEPESQGKNH